MTRRDTFLASVANSPEAIESTAMMHPLLTPRLYCQTHNQKRLPPLERREPRLMQDFLRHHAACFYRKWGKGLGLILGLWISLWLWLPDA
jgi:hypothetical protein